MDSNLSWFNTQELTKKKKHQKTGFDVIPS